MTFEQKNENALPTSRRAASASSRPPAARTAFQNFLTGNADGLCTACSYTEAERDVTNHLRFNRYEMYAQDTWRAKPNLTVDYGVRYSLYPPLTDVEQPARHVRPDVLQRGQRAAVRQRRPARWSTTRRATRWSA